MPWTCIMWPALSTSEKHHTPRHGIKRVQIVLTTFILHIFYSTHISVSCCEHTVTVWEEEVGPKTIGQ